MVRCKSDTRLFSIKDSIILTQTDTTVGFISQDEKKLYEAKSRESNKPFLKVYKDFKTFCSFKNRIPQKYKTKVRRSSKTTFIIRNKAFRVTKYPLDSEILRKLNWSYSTSANEAGKNFQREFCEEQSDIIIEDTNSLKEKSSSKLLKLSQTKIRRLR
jgi:tRNA A37 threonylcarbamoyladenosine synthetase subunit TsaC/SUA5/YrdC